MASHPPAVPSNTAVETTSLDRPKSLGRVLVVGACGFVGRHVIDHLLNFPSEDESKLESQENAPISTRSPKSLGSTVKGQDFDYPTLKSRYSSYDQTTTTVHGLDIKCTRNLLPKCTYHEADITNPTQLRALFDEIKPDLIINTASPQFDAPDHILQKVNVQGTHILLSCAKQADVKAFVHTSSSSVVHDTTSNLYNADELYPYIIPNHVQYYSETKAIAERDVLQNNDPSGMLTAAVRPAGIIGEGDLGGFLYSFCRIADESAPWKLRMQLGDGSNLFDTTYVGNVAYGLLLVAEALLETHKRNSSGKAAVLDTERVDGEAFNVTNDTPMPFFDVARFIHMKMGSYPVDPKTGFAAPALALPEFVAQLIGASSELVGFLTRKPSRISRQTMRYSCINRYYSCEKLKRRLGYVPVVGVEEGVVRGVSWYKQFQKTQGGDTKGI